MLYITKVLLYFIFKELRIMRSQKSHKYIYLMISFINWMVNQIVHTLKTQNDTTKNLIHKPYLFENLNSLILCIFIANKLIHRLDSRPVRNTESKRTVVQKILPYGTVLRIEKIWVKTSKMDVLVIYFEVKIRLRKLSLSRILSSITQTTF